MKQNLLIPETCHHAMVACPSVTTARETSCQLQNIAVTPNNNSSGDTILWTKNGEVLGLSRPNSTMSLTLNAIMWLTSIQILKSKFIKETPDGIQIA